MSGYIYYKNNYPIQINQFPMSWCSLLQTKSDKCVNFSLNFWQEVGLPTLEWDHCTKYNIKHQQEASCDLTNGYWQWYHTHSMGMPIGMKCWTVWANWYVEVKAADRWRKPMNISQQNLATMHTNGHRMKILNREFSETVNNHGIWLSCSPSIIQCD